MKVGIFYFTGSGNTELIAKTYKEALNNLNHEVELFRIESLLDKPTDFSTYDKVGIFYPVYGFNAPSIVAKFIKLQKKQNRIINYFIVMCSGEPLRVNHASIYRVNSILKRRNFLLENTYHYVMGYNMIFRHTETKAYKMYKTMKDIVPIDVKEYFDEGKKVREKQIWFGRPFAFIVRIENPFYSHINGKLFKVDDTKCIHCNMCINNCPSKNISFKDGKFKFSNKCVMCTRCSFNCPKNAIKIGILNNWKVNGKYAYKPTDIKEVDKHAKYCKKAYEKYFLEKETRIANSK